MCNLFSVLEQKLVKGGCFMSSRMLVSRMKEVHGDRAIDLYLRVDQFE